MQTFNLGVKKKLLTIQKSMVFVLICCSLIACKHTPKTPEPPQKAGTEGPPPPAEKPPPSVGAKMAVNCQANSSVSFMKCVEEARLKSDVLSLAHERFPGSKGWKQAQLTCEQRLQELGYLVERHVYKSGVNIVGKMPGFGSHVSQVLISAHYDHLRGCAGADDNASGVAATLEIARQLAGHKFQNQAVIACWDEEEGGLLGSRAYASRARLRGENIRTVVAFDGVGYADHEENSQTIPSALGSFFPQQMAELRQRKMKADFIAIVSDPASRPTAQAIKTNGQSVGLPTTVVEIGGLQRLLMFDLLRSDHAAFWLMGFPAMMVTDTANFRNPNYHCNPGSDTAQTLDYAFLKTVTQATLAAVVETLVLEAK
jgi:hypothetical protein